MGELRRVVLIICVALIATAASVAGHFPRGRHPHADDRSGHPRAARLAQVMESIEFNGLTVLHEDLLHSMQPVQEKQDITRRGIHVVVRFQFDEALAHPMSKPPSHARVSVVHNATHKELLKMPLRYDRDTRSELRGELQFDPEARRRLKAECANATCHAHVTVTNRFFGRSTVIELGRLKFYKKANGKTGIKLLTYPRIVEGPGKDGPWNYDLSSSTVFHFFLVIGAGLMLLVGSEAWRVHEWLSPTDEGYAVSRRWIWGAFACVSIYLGLCLARATGLVSLGDIAYVAPTSAVLAIAALIFAGGPPEEEEEPPFQDEDDETEDKADGCNSDCQHGDFDGGVIEKKKTTTTKTMPMAEPKKTI